MLKLNIFGRFRVADALGNEIPVKSRKSRALLAYLAMPPGKPRSREQIMALLWSDRGDQHARSSLRQALSGLRKELGEERVSALHITDEALTLDPERVIVERASPGDVLLDGLHLSDPAFEEWLRDERLRQEDALEPDPQPPGLSLPDKPSIAVLPFVNMSDDAEQEFFADGITEDIITALSRISGLLVVARHSTMVYKGKAVDVREVGREQGVRHVLEGSVRKDSNRVRVSAQLIDATTGNHEWAERYDRELDDIFEVQDDITKKVTTELDVQLARGEQARIWARGTSNLQAWQNILKAAPLSDEHVKESNVEAQRLADEAVRLDPTYAMAWVILGWTHWEDALWGWGDAHDSSMTTALSCAERALECDSESPDAFALLGFIHLTKKDTEKTIELTKKAVALSPNHAGNVALAGLAMISGGEQKSGVVLMKRAIRLSPIHPQWYLSVIGAVHHSDGEQDEAIRIFRECVAKEPNTTVHKVWLVSALIEAGELEKAKSLAAEVLEIEPDFSATSWVEGCFEANQNITNLLITNLPKAGLPS